ncbi:MAG: mechanosensitive ion channel protein MscS [Alphaproteobacteria bacterium]|nr:mechanosensitive ion channel protein MscS [Alphaproteobacteria bacterium]
MRLVTSPLRILTVGALGVALTLPMMSDAFADGRGRYHHRGHRGGSNTGAYVALGLGAAALGGLLAYQATQPRVVYEPPPPAYYAPPPAYSYVPGPTYYYDPSPPTYTYSDAPYEQMRHWGN